MAASPLIVFSHNVSGGLQTAVYLGRQVRTGLAYETTAARFFAWTVTGNGAASGI